MLPESARPVSEGSRCLRCWTNTIFAGERRGGDRVHPLRRLPGHLPRGLHRDRPRRRSSASCPRRARELAPILIDGRAEGSILIKDEEICIRCGLCARPLPRRNHHDAELRYEGGRRCLTIPNGPRHPAPRTRRRAGARLPHADRRRRLRWRRPSAPALVTLDFLKPKVLFEPPTTFRAGQPGRLPGGDRPVQQGAEGLRRSGARAASTRCRPSARTSAASRASSPTRTPSPARATEAGSTSRATSTHGPAPRPLPWLEVTLDADGNLVVDTSVIIPHGKVLKA